MTRTSDDSGMSHRVVLAQISENIFNVKDI
jgi:hypothetical protein